MGDLRRLAADLEAEATRLQDLARRARELDVETLPDSGAGRLLTANEVSKRTGLTKAQVYALFRRGEAGAVRLGERGVRFSEHGLVAWEGAGGSR